MRTLPIAVALCLWSGAATAAAAAQRNDYRDYQSSPATIVATPVALAIAAFDRDGDLRVARSEFDEEVRNSFARGDRNSDGLISLIEFSAWAEAMLGNVGALPGPFDFDRDGDDKISGAEFTAEFAKRFTSLDKNGDQALSRSELVVLVDSPFRDRRRNRRGAPEQGTRQAPPPGKLW